MSESSTTPPDGTAKEIFAAAIERTGTDRDDYVAAACGADPELRRRVDALLRAFAHADEQDFLGDDDRARDLEDRTIVEAVRPDLGPAEELGQSVGAYRLERLLGEGGFGRVYLARQEQPVARQVAVKILKPGMDSRQVIARFEAERQALALMDHPGIARIFDAGTTAAGRPYFAMEFVDGEPVTTFCDDRTLEIGDRLELFERICLAVHHAHQKGVIHRDLKPTNVLVAEHDEVPLPKVIDFGIAKAIAAPLTDRTLQTGIRQLLGTPRYMSPEQAGLDRVDVDTRSDIYSLGVLFYELLTGVVPRDEDRAEAPAPLVRPSVVARRAGDDVHERAAEARRCDPAALSRQLRGDLDWIALKALDVERNRRYDSAAAFARDVRRHLDHEPVIARRPGTGYLLWKFVQRHQIATTAVVAVVLALLIGFVLAMLGLDEADNQRRVAQAQLWESHVARARASRAGDRPGRRAESLAALRDAATIRVDRVLRDEAIACMALTDIERVGQCDGRAGARAGGLVTLDRFVWSPTPGQIVLESLDGSERITELRGPELDLGWCVLSPRAEYLVTGYPDGSCIVWNLEARARVLELGADAFAAEAMAFDRSTSPPRWVALSLATGRIQQYRLPDAEPGSSVPAPIGRVVAVADPTGSRLAVGSDESSELVIHDLTGRTEPRILEAPGMLNHLDWSPDGAWLAGASDDTNVYLWNAVDGSARAVLGGHQGQVVMVGFSDDSRVLVSHGWDANVQLWSVATCEPWIGPLRGHALVGVSDRLLTLRKDRLVEWRIDRAPQLRRAIAPTNFGAPVAIAFRDDGALFATAGKNGLRLWDAESMVELATLSADVSRSVHFVEGGAAVLGATAETLRRWPLRGVDGDGVEVGEPTVLGRFERLRSTCVAADGTTVVVVDHAGTHLFDLTRSETLRHVPGYRGSATPPSISADGRWLFTGTWKGEPARVYDLVEDEVVLQLPGIHVVGAFSPDTRALVVVDGNDYRIFDVGTWAMRVREPRDNADELAGPIAFSPDGSVVAVSYSRYVTRLVDIGTGRVLASIETPNGIAASILTFNRSGDEIALASPARDVLVFDLRLVRDRLRGLGLDWDDR